VRLHSPFMMFYHEPPTMATMSPSRLPFLARVDLG